LIASLEIGSRRSIELPNGGAPAPYVLVFRLVRLFKNPLLTIDLICDVVEGRKLKQNFIFETKKKIPEPTKATSTKDKTPSSPMAFVCVYPNSPWWNATVYLFISWW
jgi:hypothetical protein